jgi:hypothetical protein
VARYPLGRDSSRALRLAALAAGLSVLLSSCTGGSPSPPAATGKPLPPLTGRILGTIHADRRPGIAEYLLPSGRAREFPTPPNSFPFDAFWASDASTVYAMLSAGPVTRLFHLRLGHRPEAVSPPVGCIASMSHGGDAVLVAPCRRSRPVLVLDLRDPSRWRPVAAGAPAGLSPDGRTVAYSPDGRTVWVAPTDGSVAPRRILSVDAVPALAELGGSPHIPSILLGPADTFFGPASRIPVALEWGPGGLAVPVVGGSSFGYLVRRPDGRLHVVDIGGARPGEFRWSPRGALLAYISKFQGEGAKRVFDASTGTGRVVGLQSVRGFGNGFVGLAWSPDGRFTVSLRQGGFAVLSSRGGLWQIVDTEGNQLATIVAGPFDMPMDWAG